MNIEELEQKKMDIMKELASTNIKISDAKNLVLKLQEEETEYLVNREKKALAKVDNVLAESKDLLNRTHENYEEIHQFCQTVSQYADFLKETQDKFQDMLLLFERKNELWEENIKKINQEIADQRHIIKQDTENIEKREKIIIESTERLNKEKGHIESRQQALLLAHKTQKDLWEKIQSQQKKS